MAGEAHGYEAADIKVVEWRELLRRRPQMFLRGGRYSPEHVAGELVHAALLCGASEVVAERLGEDDAWWVVRSGTAWLPADDPLAVFRRITPFPASGPNGMRPEILPVAYASHVVTASRDGEVDLKGGADDRLRAHLEALRAAGSLGRLIALRGEDPLEEP